MSLKSYVLVPLTYLTTFQFLHAFMIVLQYKYNNKTYGWISLHQRATWM